jgi:hypothetical protein
VRANIISVRCAARVNIISVRCTARENIISVRCAARVNIISVRCAARANIISARSARANIISARCARVNIISARCARAKICASCMYSTHSIDSLLQKFTRDSVTFIYVRWSSRLKLSVYDFTHPRPSKKNKNCLLSSLTRKRSVAQLVKA